MMRIPASQNEEEVRRLLYAKMLFNHGVEHSHNGTVISRMIAVHNFDNAIEMILKSIAIKYNIYPQKKIDLAFKDLWGEINGNKNYKCENTKLPLKTHIFRLHDLRNGIQHHGDKPSKHDTQKYYHFAEEFIRKVLKDVFKVSYDDLFMSRKKGASKKNRIWLELYRLLAGYGEHPQNTATVSASIVFLFAFLYGASNCLQYSIENPCIQQKIIDVTYFSFVTFTTLGLGDIAPATTLGKTLICVEAVIGAFMIALFEIFSIFVDSEIFLKMTLIAAKAMKIVMISITRS